LLKEALNNFFKRTIYFMTLQKTLSTRFHIWKQNMGFNYDEYRKNRCAIINDLAIEEAILNENNNFA